MSREDFQGVRSAADRSPSVDLFAEDQQDDHPLPPSIDDVYDASPIVTDLAGSDDIPRARVVRKGPFRPPLEEADMSRAPWDSSPLPSPKRATSTPAPRPGPDSETTTAAVTTPEACDGRDLNAIPTSTGSRDARSTVPITTGSVASFIEGLRALAASYNELSPRSREVVRNAIMKAPVDVQDAISPTATAQGVSTECTPYVHHEKVMIMS